MKVFIITRQDIVDDCNDFVREYHEEPGVVYAETLIEEWGKDLIGGYSILHEEFKVRIYKIYPYVANDQYKDIYNVSDITVVDEWKGKTYEGFANFSSAWQFIMENIKPQPIPRFD
ncbi:hypothetical protein AAHH17_13990 [Lysinibacillus capsici]|uniref:hypothetical protein n=1 Tax=Lysinibacillus capsici TaxID=2115968 RepID=UPI0032E4913F